MKFADVAQLPTCRPARIIRMGGGPHSHADFLDDFAVPLLLD